jgi:SAM-dependent methyltransferase
MAMAHETALNGLTSKTFAAHAETVRGHIRYELVKRNLGEIVTGKSLAIADIGGGSAIDALWLAELGHDVTIVDPAEDQLALAQQKLAAHAKNLAGQIILKRGVVEDILEDGRGHCYDLVLSHGVAMYLDNPEKFIRSLASLTKPGGSVSLLEKGYYGAQIGLIHEGKYAESRALAMTGRLVNHQKRYVWAFKPETLRQYLVSAGATEITWSGVRVTYDLDSRLKDGVSPDELKTIVDEEYEAGKREDLRAAEPMLHFIARIA